MRKTSPSFCPSTITPMINVKIFCIVFVNLFILFLYISVYGALRAKTRPSMSGGGRTRTDDERNTRKDDRGKMRRKEGGCRSTLRFVPRVQFCDAAITLRKYKVFRIPSRAEWSNRILHLTWNWFAHFVNGGFQIRKNNVDHFWCKIQSLKLQCDHSRCLPTSRWHQNKGCV